MSTKISWSLPSPHLSYSSWISAFQLFPSSSHGPVVLSSCRPMALPLRLVQVQKIGTGNGTGSTPKTPNVYAVWYTGTGTTPCGHPSPVFEVQGSTFAGSPPVIKASQGS